MTGPRLKNIIIENFRSLRGKVVVPLDAQVVLIHGTNGMGKTSVLSALELGLTGKISHLAGDGYRRYLTTLNTGGGSITLTTTAPLGGDGRTGGTLSFNDMRFVPDALLDAANGRFFAERCYLPQATLGRLLEIYDDQKTSSTSPLTLFVKELLGLDPLDALVDGLDPAFNVTRVRKIAPDYRRLEALKTSLQQEITKSDRLMGEASEAAEKRRSDLKVTLAAISDDGEGPIITGSTNLTALRASLGEMRDHDNRLTETTRRRSELRGLEERWRTLSPEDASRDQAGKEREDQLATTAFADWRSGLGANLDQAVSNANVEFSEIPPFDDGPEKCRAEALRRTEAEEKRCEALLTTHTAAAERISALEAIIQRASVRVGELDRDLAGAAKDAKAIASALAGIVPHIDGEICPVCDRDFGEKSTEPLLAHVAAKIASLTSESGRLQALVSERAGENQRVADARRELLSAGTGQLSAEQFADLSVRKSRMTDLTRTFRDSAAAAAEGTRLLTASSIARQSLLLARRHDEQSVSILPELEALLETTLGVAAYAVGEIETGLTAALAQMDKQVANLERIARLRIEALSQVDLYARDLEQVARLTHERATTSAKAAGVDTALKAVETTRSTAKKVSEAANGVRSEIVKRVFSTSLNKVWRDLFVRLAPSEEFVPAFRLPPGQGGTVEAVLETLHRSGKISGSPGAMLSQGNLNTAALTLFLGLHLSVPVRMPWLVLDDPIQSMDDVHTAQFAALLRTLAKGMGRQIIVAVHERALFEYLMLELSPSFPGDSLIAVEITRSFNGDAIATPIVFGFEEDRAIAA